MFYFRLIIFLAMVISDYQIDTVFEESPETNTIVRIPGPDYIIKDKLGDYALEKAQKVIDGFSEVILWVIIYDS